MRGGIRACGLGAASGCWLKGLGRKRHNCVVLFISSIDKRRNSTKQLEARSWRYAFGFDTLVSFPGFQIAVFFAAAAGPINGHLFNRVLPSQSKGEWQFRLGKI